MARTRRRQGREHRLRRSRFFFAGGRIPPSGVLRRSSESRTAAPDVTLLPGLIEAHTHLFLEGGEIDPARRSAYSGPTPAELLDRRGGTPDEAGAARNDRGARCRRQRWRGPGAEQALFRARPAADAVRRQPRRGDPSSRPVRQLHGGADRGLPDAGGNVWKRA